MKTHQSCFLETLKTDLEDISKLLSGDEILQNGLENIALVVTGKSANNMTESAVTAVSELKSAFSGLMEQKITISLKRTLHFTDIGIDTNSRIRSKAALIDSTHTVVEDIKHCENLGIKNLTFDFQTNKTEECIKTMEHLMDTEHRIN